MFSSYMKDEMAELVDNPRSFQEEGLLDSDSVGMDYKDTQTEDKKENGKIKYNSFNTSSELQDLRTKPPLPGHRMHQSSSSSKMNQIIDHIEHIKDTVRINIETAMQRGENLSLLRDKAQDMQESSGLFQQRARHTQYQYCRDLYQQRCVLISAVVLILYFISAMLCGWTWHSCGK